MVGTEPLEVVGEGDEAEAAAGAMKDPGRYYILLPLALAEKAARASQ